MRALFPQIHCPEMLLGKSIPAFPNYCVTRERKDSPVVACHNKSRKNTIIGENAQSTSSLFDTFPLISYNNSTLDLGRNKGD